MVFEALGWSLAWRLFLTDRAKHDPVADPLTRATLLTVGVVGGAVGAKLSPWLDDPAATLAHLRDPAWLLGGRSVVGGLLGAWASTEVAKRFAGVSVATGDAYVRAVGFGLALARLGCFFSGVTDGTHGVETAGPLGMDLGDGLSRHPTALYEAAFLVPFAAVVARVRWPREGDAWKALMTGYLAFRLGIEAWKTQPFPWWGLSGIQLQCVGGLAVYAALLGARALRR